MTVKKYFLVGIFVLFATSVFLYVFQLSVVGGVCSYFRERRISKIDKREFSPVMDQNCNWAWRVDRNWIYQPAKFIEKVTPISFRWSPGSRGICTDEYGGLRVLGIVIVKVSHRCTMI